MLDLHVVFSEKASGKIRPLNLLQRHCCGEKCAIPRRGFIPLVLVARISLVAWHSGSLEEPQSSGRYRRAF